MLLSWLFLRILIVSAIFLTLFLAQRFWYRAVWRWTEKWSHPAFRGGVRMLYVMGIILIVGSLADSLRNGHGNIIPRGSFVNLLAGLWFFSTVFAYIAVQCVYVLDRAWQFLRRQTIRRKPAASVVTSSDGPGLPADPGRRYFFKAATAAAGATPFLGAVYGFASERLNYQIHRVELPISNLPTALDGLKIAQISDIHMSNYMPRPQVRRAVDMANDLGADLAVVTGDFITGSNDPLNECIEEIRRLTAPLGIYGCNGNHEIYAGAEERAKELFAQQGMTLLRHENALVTFRGAQFNLLGVDYQRERGPGGRRVSTLIGLESLIRKGMPNILLSHNPNTFNRAAEMGIELSLAGHTHGGQIQVEILDHRLSPARFITDYVAGMYLRPLFTPATTSGSQKFFSSAAVQNPHSTIYVNRGLGTVGAPVRIGVPPEISLLTLRRS